MKQWLFFQKQSFSSPFFLLTGAGLFLIPFLIIVSLFLFNQVTLLDLSDRVFALQENLEKKESQIKKEESLFKQISSSNPKYIQNTLESMVFLAKERQKWNLFASQVDSSHPLKERLLFLEQGNNSLQFIQNEIQKNTLFQESEEIQKQKVEMSEEDLKTVLSHVEGSLISGSPQLIFKSFELEKINIPGIKEKTYHVQMQLIKRESLEKK